MNAAGIIERLRGRGITLQAKGDRLRFRPVDAVSPEMLATLRSRKPELLEELRLEDASIEDGGILETREDLVAVRVQSRLLGRQVWLARDEQTALELHAEMPRALRLPVLLFDELPLLRGKSQTMLNVLLDAKAVFSGSRLLQ